MNSLLVANTNNKKIRNSQQGQTRPNKARYMAQNHSSGLVLVFKNTSRNKLKEVRPQNETQGQTRSNKSWLVAQNLTHRLVLACAQ